jgi:hypothetical protein
MANATRFIPARPNSDEKPFEIGDSITVFDAAMVYAGRHPHKVFLKDGSIADHLKFLRASIPEEPRSRHRARARRSWDIYRELIARIQNRTIMPIRPAYQSSGEEMDPINTEIRTADLANLAKERGEQPKYLRHLLASLRPQPATPSVKLQLSNAIAKRLKAGEKPGHTVPWKTFCRDVCNDCNAWTEDGALKRGFSNKVIQRIVKEQINAG